MSKKNEKFYAKQAEASEVKSVIVSKYFASWARIIGNQKHVERMNYIDIFCGRGEYKDGSESTPILIVRKILEVEMFKQKVFMRFNDKSKKETRILKEKIDELLKGIKLTYPPKFSNKKVEDLQNTFSGKMSPTFSFIDPFGYAGLTKKLIKDLTKDWGSDCIFFFSYSELVRFIGKNDIRKHVEGLFGSENADELIHSIKEAEGDEQKQQEIVLRALFDSLQSIKLAYLVPFIFKRKRDNDRHMIIFASKDPTGYPIIKDIMRGVSNKDLHGFPFFEYSSKQQYDFFPQDPKKELAKKLMADFSDSNTFGRIWADSASKFGYYYYEKEHFEEAFKYLEKLEKVKIDYIKDGFFANTDITDETTITILDDGNGD